MSRRRRDMKEEEVGPPPATRRLSILSSHLAAPPLGPTTQLSPSPSSSSSSSQNDCVFCRISRGQSPAFKLYEDEVCLCILDTNPVSPGHALIVPKSHYPCVEATPPDVIAAMCTKVPLISSAIMKATGADSFNLLVNSGAAAGQVIFHTHIHIIPRKARDCLWTTESLRRRPTNFDHEATKLADSVREHLSKVPGEVNSLPSNLPEPRLAGSVECKPYENEHARKDV